MPEGDAVWRTAQRLAPRASSGRQLTRTDFRVPAHRHRRPGRRHGRRDRLARQAPAHPHRRRRPARWTLHTHLKMEGSLAGLPARRALGQAGPPGPGGARDRRAHRGRLPARHRRAGPARPRGRRGRPPRPRPARPGLGRGGGRAPAASPTRTGRSARRCSTSATWPASARSTAPSCASSPATTRARRSARSPTRSGWSGWPAQMLDQNRHLPQICTTGDKRRGRSLWVYGRPHERCRRCGTPIEHAELGEPGRERAAYWCPRCQPL